MTGVQDFKDVQDVCYCFLDLTDMSMNIPCNVHSMCIQYSIYIVCLLNDTYSISGDAVASKNAESELAVLF